MLNAFTIFGLVLTILPAAYLVTAIVGAWQFRRILDRAPRHVGPGVTVLKPLCGDEVELLENLRSFCDQDYPDYQVVFRAVFRVRVSASVLMSVVGVSL